MVIVKTITTEEKHETIFSNDACCFDGRVVGGMYWCIDGDRRTDVEMRMAYNAEYDERYNTTDQEGTTGDGIVMAEAVGADLVDMEFIQTYPACSTTTGILSYVADTRFDGALLFNKEGDRFVGELDRRDE